MKNRSLFRKIGITFLTLLLGLSTAAAPSAQEPTEPKEEESQEEKQEKESTKKAKKKKSKKRSRRRDAKREAEKKEKKPPELKDVLGFVEKFYNVGMELTISEEEEIKMLVMLGDGTPKLIISKALLKMTGENFNMLGFAMAHQLGHVYSFNRRILYRDPDWKRQRWSKAAREEEYRADRFAMTLMSFSPDMNSEGAKQFLSACSVNLGDRGNFCHTLPGMFLDQEFKLRTSLDERVEFSLTTGRWISDNFVQTHAEFWSNGIGHSGERKLVRDFQSIIPSMICWPHC